MARRGNGDGSIRQRPRDGRWEARYYLPDGSRRSLMGRTRADVRVKLAQALHDMGKGVPVVDERQTVKQYLTQWFEGMKAQIRISSYRRYGDYLNHIIPAIGHVALAKLTPQHLQVFY